MFIRLMPIVFLALTACASPTLDDRMSAKCVDAAKFGGSASSESVSQCKCAIRTIKSELTANDWSILGGEAVDKSTVRPEQLMARLYAGAHKAKLRCEIQDFIPSQASQYFTKKISECDTTEDPAFCRCTATTMRDSWELKEMRKLWALEREWSKAEAERAARLTLAAWRASTGTCKPDS